MTSVQSVKDALQAAAAVVVLLSAVAYTAMWLTGGLKPQTQVAVDAITTRFTEPQTAVVELKNKIDSLPRAADYAAHEAHLSRLDGQIDELRNRLTREEVDASGMRARVERLEAGSSAPIRVPRP